MANPPPLLRHEFVGMMFAVAIGEVGLQAAALVRAGTFVSNVSAYSHLFLATVVIATSWVGWSLSFAPGARKDVTGIFEWGFLVLLIDVALVIIYFILVRTISFTDHGPAKVDDEWFPALWIALIFFLYLAWDFLTKVVMRTPDDKVDNSRITITFVCFVISLALLWQFHNTNVDTSAWRQVAADSALLFLVLDFRAFKGKNKISKWVCSLGLIGSVLLAGILPSA